MKENQQVEWKETWRDDFLKWICGFANAEGGVLHIGRNDHGLVVGLPNAARLLEEIPNKVRDILGIMIEAWGRGIERIMEACRAAHAPVPRIRYEPSGLWVEFALPSSEAAGLGEKLGENRAAIIRAIATNPKVTVVQLARQLGISTTVVENNLRYLKTQNLITRIGAAKGGVWQVNEAKL
jgi:predicted HTH transcriptional regulator